MQRKRCWIVFVAVVVAMAFPLVSVASETNGLTLDELEAEMLKDFTVFSLDKFLSICEEREGREFAWEKAKFYSDLFPDNYHLLVNVFSYCDPFSAPEEAIDVAQKIIQIEDIPAYTVRMKDDPRSLVTCTSAYLVSVYGYYELGDEEKLIECADWVVSYAGHNDDQFGAALSAYDFVTVYFSKNGNEEKALYYAKQVDEMLSKYGEQYPETMEKFSPEYEKIFLPILQKATEGNSAEQVE